MNAEIIAVGTELLLGQILNTNAQFLSIELSKLGINVFYQTVVGDNKDRLTDAIKIAMNRADILIMTGGLGPTQDDLTKETAAEILGMPCEVHQESLERIRHFFSAIHHEMASNNEKQAYLPKGCIVLQNDHGTAPGCIMEKEGKTLVLLPGPPKEMQPMFENSVFPYLRQKSPYIIYSKVIRVFGIGESSLELKLADIMERESGPTIAPYAKQGEVTLRITAKCKNEQEAIHLIEPVEIEIRDRLGIMVYGVEEESLEDVTCRLLMNKGLTIATAESCTGGLMAEKITRIPGASKCFQRGVVTYSNESKSDLLGVCKETLDNYGAVSQQTAMEMAAGIKKASGADIGISITGIAGPDGGSSGKPIGLVYVGMAADNKLKYKELYLHGNREKIREMATMQALDMVRKYLIEDLI